jgi:hypothetical protein
MKKLLFSLVATVCISLSSFAQDGKITSTNLIQQKSDVETPSELKSKSIWTEETATQFVTMSVYNKESKSFVSLTLNLDDNQIASLDVPQSVVASGSLATAYRNPPCRTRGCKLEDWLLWIESFF